MTHAALDTKGHSAEHGGLRGHSIGEHYPLSVVGVGTDVPGVVLWQVENLLDGAVLTKPMSCAEAHALLPHFHNLYYGSGV